MEWIYESVTHFACVGHENVVKVLTAIEVGPNDPEDTESTIYESSEYGDSDEYYYSSDS